MISQEELQRAINTIKDYCCERTCERCVFGESNGEMCALQIEMPYSWPDVDTEVFYETE